MGSMVKSCREKNIMFDIMDVSHKSANGRVREETDRMNALTSAKISDPARAVVAGNIHKRKVWHGHDAPSFSGLPFAS
jgi:hypothetical protein